MAFVPALCRDRSSALTGHVIMYFLPAECHLATAGSALGKSQQSTLLTQKASSAHHFVKARPQRLVARSLWFSSSKVHEQNKTIKCSRMVSVGINSCNA